MASQRYAGMRSVLLVVGGMVSVAGLLAAARPDSSAAPGRADEAQATSATHPAPLAIGSPAPDFSLPGIDGKTYSLASFKSSKVLAVIFTAVHCPTAEVYEGRIKQLVK